MYSFGYFGRKNVNGLHGSLDRIHEVFKKFLNVYNLYFRYLGRALLNGYEYELLNKKNKFTINTKDHAFFIA